MFEHTHRWPVLVLWGETQPGHEDAQTPDHAEGPLQPRLVTGEMARTLKGQHARIVWYADCLWITLQQNAKDDFLSALNVSVAFRGGCGTTWPRGNSPAAFALSPPWRDT